MAYNWRKAHGLRGALRPVLAGCAVLSTAALLPAPALAAEGKPPMIESMGTGIGGEVTVSAHINPEGLETTYEIKLECGTGEPVPCDSIPSERKEGHLAADYEVHEVSLTLTGLQPGTYWFGVHASNSAGEASQSSDLLTIPTPPPGACPNGCSKNEQYGSEIPQWYNELANSESAQTRKEYEAKQQQLAKEKEEAKAQEAARYATEEAELKQVEERDAQEAAARERQEREEEAEAEHPACRVPALKGETLTGARRALARAHCRLGALHRPARPHGTLYVNTQSAPAGKRLAHNARVALWLVAGSGAKRASHRTQGRR
jgi:hypothetical protein